jgi:hypothetical protein
MSDHQEKCNIYIVNMYSYTLFEGIIKALFCSFNITFLRKML